MISRGELDARGMVLTKDEEAELNRRAGLRPQLDDAIAYVNAHPDRFGGAFFDQSVGDLLLVVNTSTGTTDADLTEFRQRLPSGARVEYRTARYAEQELRDIKDDLVALGPATVQMVGVNITHNRVEVSPVEGRQSALQRAIGDRGDAVSVIDMPPPAGTACTSRSACTIPWRGGTKTSADGLSCTWGFNARPTTSNTTKFLIEAGHCSRLNKNVSHNSSVVNIAPGVDENTYDQLGSAWTDVLSAPLKADSGARNLIYISSVSTSYAITSIRTAAVQQPGDSVCISAVTSGYKCGTIELEHGVLTYPRIPDNQSQTFTELTRVSFNFISGDSGGPVISGTQPQAFGLVSATAGGNGFYGPIDLALSEVSLRLCLNAACS
jgi:hypothetical protein